MHRVSSLKRNNFIPTATFNFIANLNGGSEGIGEVNFKITVVQYLNLS